MAVCDNKLYVGTSAATPDTADISSYPGCQVWRYDGGTSWTQVNIDGFGNNHNTMVRSMATYDNKLYAGIYYYDPAGAPSSNKRYQILRYDGGTSWNPVRETPFGEKVEYPDSMAVMGSKLYVAIANYMTGVTVLSYDGATWEQVSTPGLGDRWNSSGRCMTVFDDKLYLGTGTDVLEDPIKAGCRVWRYDGGTSWSQVNTDGFGTSNNKTADSMIVFKSDLYVGTWNQVTGCEIWRFDGISWQQVNAGGFGSPNDNSAAGTLAVYNFEMYAGAYQNIQPGSSGFQTSAQGRPCQVWRESAPQPAQRVAATDSIGVSEPRQKWYLAEGSTDGGMETFVLIQNPNDTDVQVNIKFQTDTGEKAPADLQGIGIPARSRLTYKVNNYVASYNVSSVVDADKPVIVERALYISQ
jgi:hypothetical protein